VALSISAAAAGIEMKLVMTLLVRDEEDILAVNLEHHLALGVSQVLVTDNRSIDATPDILADYARSGVVRVMQEPGDDFSQWRWVTRMAHIAAGEGADWIMHADADEFWCPAGSDLPDALGAVPPQYGVVAAPRFNFPPTEEEAPPFYERLVIRETASSNVTGRPLPGKCCHRPSPDVQIAQGNHEVQGRDLRRQPQLLPVDILHFPMRTFRQFERRIIVGGQAYACNRELPVGIGDTWRRLYTMYRQGRLRDHWDMQVLTPERLTAGLSSGQLRLDTRVRDAARVWSGGEPTRVGTAPP
jgi:Glycosyl transferase family 2